MATLWAPEETETGLQGRAAAAPPSRAAANQPPSRPEARSKSPVINPTLIEAAPGAAPSGASATAATAEDAEDMIDVQEAVEEVPEVEVAAEVESALTTDELLLELDGELS